MEENNIISKRKIAIFSTVAIIISYIFSALSNVTISYLLADYGNSMTKELLQLFESCTSIAVNLLTLSAFLILGHILTKDKHKTFIFAGSMYFGKQTVAIVTSLISAILNSLMYTGALFTGDGATAIFVTDLLFVPLDIFVAYFIYTALEGINSKVNGSLDTTELTLSRARKRYIAYTLIGSVVIGIISSAPNYIFALMYHETGFSMSVWSSVINKLVLWLGNTLSFAILFFAGYKAYKSLIDGMAFGVCSGVAGGISGVITSVMFIPVRYGLNYLTTALETDINPLYMALISTGTVVFSVVSTVISIVAVCFMMKYFFPPMKVTLFTEQAPVSEGVSVAADEAITVEEVPEEIAAENDGIPTESEEK